MTHWPTSPLCGAKQVIGGQTLVKLNTHITYNTYMYITNTGWHTSTHSRLREFVAPYPVYVWSVFRQLYPGAAVHTVDCLREFVAPYPVYVWSVFRQLYLGAAVHVWLENIWHGNTAILVVKYSNVSDNSIICQTPFRPTLLYDKWYEQLFLQTPHSDYFPWQYI